MAKLTPQQKKILDYLADGEWHCMANANFYMKDDRKRISELNDKGYDIQGERCKGMCGIKHSAGIYMRRLAALPPPNKYQIFHELKQLEL